MKNSPRNAQGRIPLMLGAVLMLLFCPPDSLGRLALAEEAQRSLVKSEERGQSPVPPTRSSLHHLVAWLKSLPIDEPSLVAMEALDSTWLDEPAAAALHQELVEWLAPQISSARIIRSEALDPRAARSLARSKDLSLTLLSPRFVKGKLFVRVQVIRFARSFWQRVRFPQGYSLLTRETSVPLDAMLRRYFPKPTSEKPEVLHVDNPVSSPLAVDCGDVDGDGTEDIVIVGRREIAWGHVEGNLLKISGRKPWSELSPLSPSPLRSPLASVVILDRRIWVGSSDRAEALLLTPNLQPVARSASLYPQRDGSCSAFTNVGLSFPAPDCTKPTTDDWDVTLTTNFVEESGAITSLFAGVPAGKLQALVELAGPVRGTQKYEIENVGAQIAFADFDGDGVVEMVSSLAVPSTSAEDAVVVRTMTEDGPKEVQRWPFPRVHALGTCPFFGENPTHLVIAAGKEIVRISP